MTPRAAERLSREGATQKFAPAARALATDWGMGMDGTQVERWSEALGRTLVHQRDREVLALEEGRRPAGPAHGVPLLVIGMDGGRWQGREKNEQTGSRWREDKVLTVSSYLRGDGKEQKPQLLLTTQVATIRDAEAFGWMARVEAERRGVREAEEVIGLGDGGNWIDPQFSKHFRLVARIIDWCHASEHLWSCAKAIHGAGTANTAKTAETWEAWLWDGQVARVIAALSAESQRLGLPQEGDGPDHPRRVLAQNVGYFTKHQEHMRYPEYRARGWPIGSGVTEASVKQFNKRVKGTEQFWGEAGIESILTLRAMWLGQDERWEKYWANRPAYVN